MYNYNTNCVNIIFYAEANTCIDDCLEYKRKEIYFKERSNRLSNIICFIFITSEHLIEANFYKYFVILKYKQSLKRLDRIVSN